jgi:hypothetical protein
MFFLRYRFKFFTCFSKKFCDWYMNWNKRVRSERRKSHFRGPRFQNFPGGGYPRTPLQTRDLMYALVSSGAGSAPVIMVILTTLFNILPASIKISQYVPQNLIMLCKFFCQCVLSVLWLCADLWIVLRSNSTTDACYLIKHSK